MSHPIIGWEQEAPVPNHTFNHYLSARAGHLYFEDLDLAALFVGQPPRGLSRSLISPLELIYLPKIRQNIAALRQVFAEAIRATNYAGEFHYVYTSKANAAEEVIRTALQSGVYYEASSSIDVDIARLMWQRGHLGAAQIVLCNGFKGPGTAYSRNIIQFQSERGQVWPVMDDLTELEPLLTSGVPFDVGVRQKSYGQHDTLIEMEHANSRFGMTTADIGRAADLIERSPNLRLTLYHAMVGSQIIDEADFTERLTPPMEIYAHLKQRHPHLNYFDFGGGLPAPMTLDFKFDYAQFARRLLTTMQAICAKNNVPVPQLVGEMGRYTVAEHGAHIFKVINVKHNDSALPWYILDGSIMSSLPDTWALGEHFITLPLNHLDKPFQRVQLGGMTCDSDDIYPPRHSTSPLYLPVVTDDLYVGFFSIGAYQEMLGGVGGTKHCIIPEADELIIDRASDGAYHFELLPPQSYERILENLGYRKT